MILIIKDLNAEVVEIGDRERKGEKRKEMNTQQNLVNLVQAFQEAANRHNVDMVMGMFSDDAEFELVGLYRIVGKQQIRAVFEYDAGVHTELQFINCQQQGDTVKGQIVERNDRLEAVGFSKLHYPSCVLTFKGELIQKFIAKPKDESVRALTEVWQAFLPWIARKYPAEHAKIFTPQGRFIYNRENGERVVPLLREWQSGRGKIEQDYV